MVPYDGASMVPNQIRAMFSRDGVDDGTGQVKDDDTRRSLARTGSAILQRMSSRSS